MPEEPIPFDAAALLCGARTQSASIRQEFERVFGPGVRALLRYHLGSTDLDHRTEDTLTDIIAGVRENDIRPQDLLCYVRQRIKTQIVSYLGQERAPVCWDSEDSAESMTQSARRILSAIPAHEWAILDRTYRLLQTDDEIASGLALEVSEVEQVRRRVRAEFARLAARPQK